MNQSLLYNTSSLTISLLLAAGMLLCYFAGWYVKKRKIAKHPEFIDEGMGPIEGALLGLLALLLSFTFSMSSSRHDSRFQVLVEEANAIGTAILRADFYPDSERVVIRGYFKNYVESRIALYDAGADLQKNKQASKQTQLYADSLWKIAAAATKSENITARNRGSLMAASLNDMIDAITKRKAANDTTVPDSILYQLFLLCFASSFIIGNGTKKKPDTIIASGFTIMVAITVFSILDLDRPHRGLITLDKAEQNMIELRDILK